MRAGGEEDWKRKRQKKKQLERIKPGHLANIPVLRAMKYYSLDYVEHLVRASIRELCPI